LVVIQISLSKVGVKKMSAATQFGIAHRFRKQCQAQTGQVRCAAAGQPGPAATSLSPEDKTASQVGRFST
jgi:hypothetical protein